MKEQLYTIPVNDAFRADCECPICKMREELEKNAIEYTLGPSYMEDDNRAQTDKLGFCGYHIQKLYDQKNRLGLALMLKTHTDKTIKDLEKLSGQGASGGLFKKSGSPVGDYVRDLESHCFICERIETTFEHYIDTVFHLWKKDPAFQEAFKNSKGFCTYHYGLLFETGANKLDKAGYQSFLSELNKVYFTGMKRVNDDLEWFINKFDYRYQNEPWKNSKDAIPRAILKTNHMTPDERSNS